MSARTGDDLLFQEEVRDLVRSAYRAIPAGAGRAVAEQLYSAEELAAAPEAAIAWALGVGNPVRHAGLQPGEVVLDVGCGGGLDTVLAAHRVGPGGRVVGLDMLPEMCERARATAQDSGTAPWCEFLHGEMEAIPLPDASVDVVISNGVLNLSPRKSRALAEVARVLRPGGRLCVADLTVEDDLPPEVLASGAAWAGCIAGAVSERVLARKLERAGLVDIALSAHTPFGLDDVALYPLFTPEIIDLMRRLIPDAAAERVAVGVIVHATKPAAASPAGRRDGLATASGTKRLADIAPAAAEVPGVTIRHLKDVEDVELKVLEVEPHGATPYHTHPHAHEGVVVSGAGALQLDERADLMQPGDVFSVNPTEPHAIVNTGVEPLRIVCMDCFVQ